MKKAKKFFAALFAVVLVLSVATIPAFAAGTNTITVNGAQKGETYKIFKMLDLSVNESLSAYSYTVNAAWDTFFDTGAGADYVDIAAGTGYVTWKAGKDTATDMEAFGKAAAKFAADNSLSTAAADITPTTDSNITFSSLLPGYYLITSTNGTLAIVDTTPTNPAAIVNEKNDDPTVTKQVQEDSNDSWGSTNSAQIGDTVYFKVTINLKKGAKDYVLNDTMSSLTLNADSIKIDGLTKGTDYIVKTGPDVSQPTHCFEIEFQNSYLNGLTADTTLTVTYNATLNETAQPASFISGCNSVMLTWGANSSTAVSETKTNTYKFEVLKYDGKDTDKKPLAGAVFQLKDADGNVVKLIKVSDTEYRVANGDEAGAVESFTTVDTGNIVITGVDLDTYTLVETEAPAGYNKLTTDTSLTVLDSNALVVEIANNAGAELPSTGGIGTTIFYVVGGVLVVAAVVLLVTKKRMSGEK